MLEPAQVSNTKSKGKVCIKPHQTNSIGNTSALGLLRRIILVETQQEEEQRMHQCWLTVTGSS